MKRIILVLMAMTLSGCIGGGWTRHDLTPESEEVKISKNEPQNCTMVGGFSTYTDCLKGLGTGDTNMEAQYECIKWKTNMLGGNFAVLDASIGDGYLQGRCLKCPE